MNSHIYIYGMIGSEGVSAERIKNDIDKCTYESITVHISSQGGEVYEGYTIYNLLKNSGKKINVVIEGFCASIATLIALVGNEPPMMYDTASFMIHNPFAGVEGDANELRKTAEHLDTIKAELIKVYGEKTGLSNQELWSMMDKETFFTANEAEAVGFAKKTTDKFLAVAYFDEKKLNKKVMAETKNMVDDLKKELSSFKNMISKMIRTPKNMEAKLDDGSMVFIETEGEIVGAPIFKLDESGATQQLEDGTYTLEDGQVLTVAGGVVASVQEVEAKEDVSVLKNEIERLTNELNASNEAITVLKNEAEAKTLALSDLNTKIENVLSQLPAGVTVSNSMKKPAFKAIAPKNEVKEEVSAIGGWGVSMLKEKML